MLLADITTWQIVKQLSEGLLVSMEIFFLTLFFALPLGLLIAFGRMSKFAPLRWLCIFYISVMRGTPLMLQLLVWYFAPFYLFGIKLSSLALCLFSSIWRVIENFM